MFKLNSQDVKYLIIHHSATSRDGTTFGAIKSYHTKTLGWEDCGYHYVITGEGILFYGRHVEFVGDHCKTPAPSMNFRSLGICLTGNFEIEKPSDAQIVTLENLLLSLSSGYKIPIANILGHREAPGAATLCPGKNLLSWLKDYRGGDKKKLLSQIQETLKNLVSLYQNLLEKFRSS